MSVQPTSAKRTMRQLSGSGGAERAYCEGQVSKITQVSKIARVRKLTRTQPGGRRLRCTPESPPRALASVPIRRVLRVPDRLDVIEMIDGKLPVIAPLALGQSGDFVGDDGEFLSGRIASQECLRGALEVVEIVEGLGDGGAHDHHAMVRHQEYRRATVHQLRHAVAFGIR